MKSFEIPNQKNSREQKLKDPSKRKFLKIGLGTAAFIADKFVSKALDTASEESSFEKLGNEIEEQLNYLESNYGLHVNFTPIDRLEMMKGWEGDELSMEEKNKILHVISEALEIYPKFLIGESSSRKHLRMVKGLIFMERDGKRESPGGLEFNENLFYLTYPYESREIAALCFHHEIFHTLEDKFYATSHVCFNEDNMWKKLNPPCFNYHYPSFKEAERDALNIFKRGGFARKYGMTTEFEDRATIYEELTMHYGSFIKRLKSDSVLREKTRRIKKFLFSISNGLMDDEYWENMYAGSKYQFGSGPYFCDKAEEIKEMPLDKYVELMKKQSFLGKISEDKMKEIATYNKIKLKHKPKSKL